MRKWCFNCKHFSKNSHGMNVDPELWVAQSRAAMPEYGDENCWRMKGETIVGRCAKDGGNGVILCMATLDDCPGWESQLSAAAQDFAKAAVRAYEGMGTELLLHGKTERARALGDAYDTLLAKARGDIRGVVGMTLMR